MSASVQHLWIGLAGGLFASAHCLGMCGGFALHLSQDADRGRAWTRQLLWLAGKTVSYTFLGALAGFAGAGLGGVLSQWGVIQNLLSYLAGGVILLMAANLLGLMPVRALSGNGPGSGLLTALGRDLFSSPSPGAALSLGLLTGFLPCPVVLSFLAYALQSGSVTTGMVSLAALGLGTLAPLLLLGTLGRLSWLRLRNWAPRAGAVVLLLLGLTTLLRGTDFLHRLLGCPAPLPHASAGAPAPDGCCRAGNHAHGH